ncbi:MAG: cyclophilin-like fold protein [Phascolarctobacterium sp.]
MKKLFFVFGLILAFFTTACGASPAAPAPKAEPAKTSASANVKKVRITIDGRSGVLNLYDTPVSNELYKQLPLTLSFSDFNSTEKIATPPKAIHEGYKPEGHAPQAGDLCLYAPWGNLCFFYRDYKHSGDLFSLGRLESGLDLLASQKGDFSMTLEKL